jgi:hypothetical protein
MPGIAIRISMHECNEYLQYLLWRCNCASPMLEARKEIAMTTTTDPTQRTQTFEGAWQP